MAIRGQTARKLEQKAEDSESLRLIDAAKSFLNKDMNDVRLPKGTQLFEVTKIDPVRKGMLYYFEFYSGHASNCRNYQDGIKIEMHTLYRVSEGTKKLHLNL
ncbi:hypothetical protein J4480_01585 [Candidatus Woesearchaeota archaeon]|nr:hypothetical protein [Candidatus Woesearchaeota archaeon]